MLVQWRGIFRLLIIIACLSLLVIALPAKAQDSAVSLGVGDTILTVSGRTSPGAFVIILDGGTTIGTTIADSSGNFSQTFTAFAPGVHTLIVYARDTSGRITSPVEKEVSVAEHFETIVNFFLPPTLAIDNATVPVNSPITMQGSTIPGGRVVILIDDVARSTVTADLNGQWNYVLDTTGMAAGNHTIYAIVSDPVTAEQSYPTSRVPITLVAPQDTTTPLLPPPFVQPVKPDVPVITHPTNGSTVEGPELSVRGTAQPGTRIELYNGSQLIGSTFANSSGEWEIIITLSEPSYSIRARACRLLICSDFSQSVNFFWQSFGGLGEGLSIRLEQYWFLIAKGHSITHNLHISGGTPPYNIAIDWGDGSTYTLNGKDLLLTFSDTYTKAGKFVGTVIVTDKEGRQARQTFTVEAIDFGFNWLFIIFILLLILILLLLFILYRRRKKKRNSPRA